MSASGDFFFQLSPPFPVHVPGPTVICIPCYSNYFCCFWRAIFVVGRIRNCWGATCVTLGNRSPELHIKIWEGQVSIPWSRIFPPAHQCCEWSTGVPPEFKVVNINRAIGDCEPYHHQQQCGVPSWLSKNNGWCALTILVPCQCDMRRKRLKITILKSPLMPKVLMEIKPHTVEQRPSTSDTRTASGTSGSVWW